MNSFIYYKGELIYSIKNEYASEKQNDFIKRLIFSKTKMNNNQLEGKWLISGNFQFKFTKKHKSGIHYGVPRQIADLLIKSLMVNGCQPLKTLNDVEKEVQEQKEREREKIRAEWKKRNKSHKKKNGISIFYNKMS